VCVPGDNLMASIRVRIDGNGGKAYHVQVRIKGFPPQTKTFDSLSTAKKWASLVETELRNGRWMPRIEAEKHSVKEALEKYLNEYLTPNFPKRLRTSGAQLGWWIEKMGAYSLADLTPGLIGRYRDELQQTPLKKDKFRTPATVVRYMAVLSHALTILVKEWGWLEESPMPKVSKPRVRNARTRFLGEAERERLLAAAKESPSQYLYAIVLLAISTGMRRGEILSLQWRHVMLNEDGQSALLLLEHTKNDDQRGVPLVGIALHEMERLRQIAIKANHGRLNPEALLFPSTRSLDKPLEIRKAWETILRLAKLDSAFKFHDLRHTAASYLAMSGATSRDIAEVLGHKSLAMVKRYAHLSKDHLIAIMTQMNIRLDGDPVKGK
jgi:integrase